MFSKLISKFSNKNVFKPTEDNQMARIITTETGALLLNDGVVVGKYTRARDARRAAGRRGLVLA